MKNVTVYTTSSCVYCKMTKEFFADNHIAYTEKNIATDQAAAEEMIEKSGQMGVPVTIITGDGKDEVVVGFDEDRLSTLLVPAV